jgi:hypothetical protein
VHELVVEIYGEHFNQLSYDFQVFPPPVRVKEHEARAVYRGLAIYHGELSEATRERMKQEAKRPHA